MKTKVGFELQNISDVFCKLRIEILVYCITCTSILFVWRMRDAAEAVANASEQMQDIYGRSPGFKAQSAENPKILGFFYDIQLSAHVLSMVAVTLTYIRRLIKAL